MKLQYITTRYLEPSPINIHFQCNLNITRAQNIILQPFIPAVHIFPLICGDASAAGGGNIDLGQS